MCLYLPAITNRSSCKLHTFILIYLHKVLATMSPSCNTSEILVLFLQLTHDHFCVGSVCTALKVDLFHFCRVKACCCDQAFVHRISNLSQRYATTSFTFILHLLLRKTRIQYLWLIGSALGIHITANFRITVQFDFDSHRLHV